VLDTWFSSGLWPFSTLGWPEDTEDLRRFYPTSLMETGYDILFFWVARMIMMGLEFTGQAPFHTVYLHGLVRDELGRKMSKTLGNVIDPLQVMDEFGTDALRFTLLTGSSPGNDMNLSLQRVEANRNFANKLWNAGRLILGLVEAAPAEPEQEPPLTLADDWIRARTRGLIRQVDRLFAKHQYGEAGRQTYEFFWSEFADWYLEIAKLQAQEGGPRAWTTAWMAVHVFDTCLRLLHPFTPYVTEELWGLLKGGCQAAAGAFAPAEGWEEALIVARWPEPRPEAEWEAQAVERFQPVQQLVTAIRNARAEKGVEPGRRIEALIQASELAPMLQEQAAWLAALARLDPEKLQITARLPAPPEHAVPLVVGPLQAYLPLAGMVDLERERARLTREREQSEAQIRRLEQLLAGPFAERAPAEVVQGERRKLEGLQRSEAQLREQIEALG
jgi:valyl-tRNA synthetase